MSSFLQARKRLVIVSIGLCLLFSLLIVQFFKIQVIEREKWVQLAGKQHQLIVVEPFRRGLFYSNTSLKLGHPEREQALCLDVPKFHLYADPQNIPHGYHKEIVYQLTARLDLSEERAKNLLVQLEKKSRSRKLVLWLSFEEREKVEAWWLKFARSKRLPRNALFFIQDYKRSYPFGKLLGPVLHTLREEKDETTKQGIPTGGLELTFDRMLQGKEGKRVILRSPRHALETGDVLYEPEDGADVYLTINHYLQAVAEEEIAKAVKKANAKGGWAVLMEPKTGEIWALAQYPYFEPADYRSYFNHSEKQEHTKVKAITDPFEPASTMKPITLALAFKANEELKRRGKPPLFSPQERICTLKGNFPGRTKPVRDVRTHSYLNMFLALQKSSNIYMSKLAERMIDQLGEKWYRDSLQEIFGFGLKSGIELPSESPGMLPTPGKHYKGGRPEWSKATPFSLAFGHNLLTTSLQMLKAYAIIANGGYDVNPTLVRKVVQKKRDGSEEILLDNSADKKEQKRLLEYACTREVVRAMKAVTKPGGTASKADIYGYTEAGKTATSEKIVGGTYSKRDHIANFIGFAPAENPRFVLMVVIDEPEFKFIPGMGKNQHSGNCCAPAFVEIGLKTLQYLGVEPDDPYGYPIGDPRRDETKADWMQEIKGLKELYQQWNGGS